MKIYFDNCNFESTSGPNSFAKRLAIQFTLMGHELADATDDYDIALCFIEPSSKLNLNKPIVQRLDGIWFKPEEHYQGKNKLIEKLYHYANGVVLQSNFSKKMTSKWFGEPRNSTIIYNGIELKDIEVTPELQDFRSKFDQIFVCSASWHPQKRLKDNIKFYKAVQNRYNSSALIVLGNNPDHMIADPNVFYAGLLSHELCLQIYKISDWMLHLSWAENCPNVVIEALSQDCNVICTDVGGTCELINENNGIVIKDQDYNFTLEDYDSPPVLNIDYSQINLSKKQFDKFSIDIVNVANQYIEYFQYLTNNQ